MDRAQVCDFCQERKAVTTCDMCGSHVCKEHNRDYGCDVCKGGVNQFE